jgi:nucleoside-diphosphate-sugar epimerase
MARLRVLLTGASGRMGPHIMKGFRDRYDLRTFGRRDVPDSPDHVCGDIADFGAIRGAMDGIEVLVHLSANAYQWAEFEEVLQPNIVGVYNTFRAAQEAGVRRIVHASSCHTILGYPRDASLTVNDTTRPDGFYGASKVFSEALGRYYHDRYGIEFLGIRVGAMQPASWWKYKDRDSWIMRHLWLSVPDGVRLFTLAVEKPDVGYAVVFGTSITEREFVSRREAREVLGFEPQDSVADV